MKKTPEWLEYKSQALKKLVAAALRANPEKLNIAKDNIERWRDEKGLWGRHTPYIKIWERAISEGVEACCILLEDKTEDTQALRSAAPFAGIISEKERQSLLENLEKKGYLEKKE